MKTKTNHSTFFKALVLVLAFALAVLCAPFDALVALAQTSTYTDYSFMTIGKTDDEVKTTVTKGQKYTITDAFIGGNQNFVVGDADIEGDELFNEDEKVVTLDESSVVVKYSTENIAVTDGEFVADKLGTYTVIYSYQYTVTEAGEVVGTYTNKYELKVNSELASATISFESNEANFVPSIIDLAQMTLAKDGDTVLGYKDVNGDVKNVVLPFAKITGEDDEEIEIAKANYITSEAEMVENGKYVLVTVSGGQNASSYAPKKDADGNLYIESSIFAKEEYAAGNYTVKYSLYDYTKNTNKKQFVTSATKSFKVYADAEANADDYYEGKEYKLDLQLASSWSDNGQTGIESTLPAAKGVTSKETVDVYYRVKVKHSSNGSANSWNALDATKYADVLDADGYLKDATKFKPLEDGYYTFIYEIEDFYGNKKASQDGVYTFKDVKDEQAPTPIIYDAAQYVGANADNEKVDETYKLQSRSVPNGVVVYAIAMKDNVDTVGTLNRKIMTDETVTKLDIDEKSAFDLDKYNLVFNYRNTSGSNNAYANLLANNAVLAKTLKAETIDSDAKMLEELNKRDYKIVVDNANYETIYNIFASYFTDNNIDTVTDKATALEWFKTKDALDAGFAYIDTNETFGATTGENGMGAGSYRIRYIAKDATGNEKETTRSMYIGYYDDSSYPELKFNTTLADSYVPESKITFDAPTASDNYDTNMLIKTMYRYLKKDRSVVTFETENDKVAASVLTDLKADLGTVQGASSAVDKDGVLLTKKYSKFFDASAEGYVALTNSSKSSYTIDLGEVDDTAAYLQIVTFVYDDCGNANMYAEEVEISNAIDHVAPQVDSEESTEAVRTEYVQGEEVELPTLTVLDDAVAFMNYDVKVYHVNGDVETQISTYGAYAERDVLNPTTGAGSYTIHAGKFVASFDGEYRVSISAKDSKNNTVVKFVNYTVTPRNIVQKPQISAALENKTVELDELTAPIAIPAPKISYEIPNSTTYDVKDEAENADKKYVVIGVDSEGKAKDWSVTNGDVNGFKPTEVGEYNIRYTVKLKVYDREMFTFKEMTYDASTGKFDKGGYFTFNSNYSANTARFETLTENSMKVVGDTSTFVIEKDLETNAISVYDVDGILIEDDDLASLDGFFVDYATRDDLNVLFEGLKYYNLESETYTIIAQDTKGPVLPEFDYPLSMSTTELAEDGIVIKGIETQADASGINASKSKIVVSWKLANGESGTETITGDKIFNPDVFKKSSTGKNYDGTYKITYTVYDNNNNYTTKDYSISVGDNVAPTVTVTEDFIADKYDIGTPLEINISDITVKDNKTLTNPTKVVTLTNTSTSKVVNNEGTADKHLYNLKEVGSYTLTVEVEDAVGNKTTETYKFEVTAKSNDSTKTYQIVGTVLIVVSVLILAGVIVYFIVSKVKLDKELKK